MSASTQSTRSLISRINEISMRLSSNTGRKPSLTNSLAVTAPLTPIPPVISTFIIQPSKILSVLLSGSWADCLVLPLQNTVPAVPIVQIVPTVLDGLNTLTPTLG